MGAEILIKKGNNKVGSCQKGVDLLKQVSHQTLVIGSNTTSHMTADVSKLHSLQHYYGSDKIMVGNGNALDITHEGQHL